MARGVHACWWDHLPTFSTYIACKAAMLSLGVPCVVACIKFNKFPFPHLPLGATVLPSWDACAYQCGARGTNVTVTESQSHAAWQC